MERRSEREKTTELHMMSKAKPLIIEFRGWQFTSIQTCKVDSAKFYFFMKVFFCFFLFF